MSKKLLLKKVASLFNADLDEAVTKKGEPSKGKMTRADGSTYALMGDDLLRIQDNISQYKGAGKTLLALSPLALASFTSEDSKPLENKKEATDFEKAFSKAFKEGKETFTFKGKEYTTEVRKGKAEGSEIESSATTRTREAAIEKDERERRERMMKAEAKRLGISEERLKEILLEREQAEMDRKGSEAAGRFEKTPMAEGGKFPDLTGDGEVTQADVLKGRGVFAEGSEVKPAFSTVGMAPNTPKSGSNMSDELRKYIELQRTLSSGGSKLLKLQTKEDTPISESIRLIEDNFQKINKSDQFKGSLFQDERGFDGGSIEAIEMLDSFIEQKSRSKKAEGSLAKEELEDGTYDVQRMEGDDFKSIVMSRPLREDEGGFTDKELQEYRERMALFDKLAEPYVKAGKPIPKKINDLSLGKVPPSLSGGMDISESRSKKAEGSMLMPVEGMPVDTYPNIPEDEMDEALASQLPDDEMEDDYISYVMDESLSDSEQDYLAGVLQQDDRLSDILDKVITTASEFSGAGEVEGPGTGVSDSIPARLSDGEFVFTKKATDQIGADALQRMMDDAERAYDGGLQAMANGGMMEDEDPENPAMSKTKEEIEKLMMGANRMPSLR